jgi:hypothetical protein
MGLVGSLVGARVLVVVELEVVGLASPEAKEFVKPSVRRRVLLPKESKVPLALFN